MKMDLTNAELAAKTLLGWELRHITDQGVVSGYIVETEAYCQNDAASHSFNGPRQRNAPMFRQAGTIYVYLTYGMHYCLNIVTGPIGSGQAALIRALQPIEGIDIMMQNRHNLPKNLTNGPAKLTQALKIGKNSNGLNVFDQGCPIKLIPGFTPKAIVQTTRIGISKEQTALRRFYIKDNPWVSVK